MVESFYLPLVLLAAAVGAGFSLFAWYNRDKPGARALTGFLAAASVWALAEGLTVAEGRIGAMEFWAAFALSVSVVLPPAWLVFVLEYTGGIGRLSRRGFAVLLLEPLVFLPFVWTNDGHGRVWTDTTVTGVGEQFNTLSFEFGLVFWGHQVYVFCLLTLGMVLLVRTMFRTTRRIRREATIVLVAIFVPAALNAAYSFGVIPRALDPTGVAYILAGLVILVSVFEPQLARIAPVTRDAGREAVLSEIDDAVLILDDDDRLLDANPAAYRLLSIDEETFGRRLSSIDPELADRLDSHDQGRAIELDVEGMRRYYDVRLSSLSGAYGVVSGRVLSLRDVTERRQREQRIDVLNRLLRHNIRNELNVVRGNIELTKKDMDGVDQGKLDKAIESIDGIVERSDKVGRLSRLLDEDEGEPVDIARELRGEFDRQKRDRLDGEVDIGLPEKLVVTGGPSLVAAFDELVTNALAHNDSETPRVTLSVDESASDERSVVLTVTDNGPGIDLQEIETLVEGTETPLRHSSGVGLWLVTWVVRRAGGTVAFENTDSGSTVSVRLPRPDTSRLSGPGDSRGQQSDA